MSQAAAYTLTIPGWRPCSANELYGHPGKRGRLKARDAEVLGAARVHHGVPAATGKRRVAVTVVQAGRGRPLDADNVCKSLLDGLVRARLLVDDGPAFCELGPVRIERGPAAQTVITLEDL